MECDASVNRSITEFILDQSYFVQTAIMLGFVLLVFFAITVFWISSLVGGDFSFKFSVKVQEWAGALSFLSIISILCTLAIEMNYWTNYQISKCNLSGMVSVTKTLSFIVIFTLQIIWVNEFFIQYLRVRKRKRFTDYRDRATIGAFRILYRKHPIFKRSFPNYYEDPTPSVTYGKFRTYGVWMFVGAIYSILTASIHWLKFLTVNLGLTDLKLNFDFLGVEIKYTFIFEKLTYLHTIWMGCPFVNFVVDSLISIAAISWFMWRFKLYPKIPWIIRKFILKKP